MFGWLRATLAALERLSPLCAVLFCFFFNTPFLSSFSSSSYLAISLPCPALLCSFGCAIVKLAKNQSNWQGHRVRLSCRTTPTDSAVPLTAHRWLSEQLYIHTYVCSMYTYTPTGTRMQAYMFSHVYIAKRARNGASRRPRRLSLSLLLFSSLSLIPSPTHSHASMTTDEVRGLIVQYVCFTTTKTYFAHT